MAEISQCSCCRRALPKAQLQDHKPTLEEIAWLFGISRRWVTELRNRGVMPEDATLPVLVKRMAKYKPEAKQAGRRSKLAKLSQRRDG